MRKQLIFVLILATVSIHGAAGGREAGSQGVADSPAIVRDRLDPRRQGPQASAGISDVVLPAPSWKAEAYC